MKKRFLSIAMFVIGILSLGNTNAALADTIKAFDLKKGDIVELGRFKGGDLQWRVANFDDDRNPILVSKYIVDFKPFSGQYPVDGRNFTSQGVYQGDPYWARSALRDWLNSDETPVFYQATPPSYFREAGFLKDFTEEEKSVLVSEAQDFESGPIQFKIDGAYVNQAHLDLKDSNNTTGLYYLRAGDPIQSRIDYSVDRVSLLNNADFTSGDWDVRQPEIPSFIAQYLDAKGILSTNQIRAGKYVWGKGIYGVNNKGVYIPHVYRWEYWNEYTMHGSINTSGRMLAGDSYVRVSGSCSIYAYGYYIGAWYGSAKLHRGEGWGGYCSGEAFPKIKPSTLENYGVMPTIIIDGDAELIFDSSEGVYKLSDSFVKMPKIELTMPEKQYLAENSYFEMSGKVESGNGEPVEVSYKVFDLLSKNKVAEGVIGIGVNITFDMTDESNMVYMDPSFAYDNTSFVVRFYVKDSLGRTKTHDALVYIRNKNPYEYLIPSTIPAE